MPATVLGRVASTGGSSQVSARWRDRETEGDRLDAVDTGVIATGGHPELLADTDVQLGTAC